MSESPCVEISLALIANLSSKADRVRCDVMWCDAMQRVSQARGGLFKRAKPLLWM